MPASGQDAYIRVLDSNIADPATFQDPQDLRGTPAWKWARITPDIADKAVLLDDSPPAAASVLQYDVDGQTLILEGAADFSSSSLLHLEGKAGPQRVVTTPGAIFSAVRIR